MEIALQINRYLQNNSCTIKEFSNSNGFSESAVRKWLYKKHAPSRRMMGVLLSIEDFFTAEELVQLNSLFKGINYYGEQIHSKQGGGVELIKILKDKSVKQISFDKTKDGEIEMKAVLDEKEFLKSFNLNVNYEETKKVLEKYEYKI